MIWYGVLFDLGGWPNEKESGTIPYQSFCVASKEVRRKSPTLTVLSVAQTSAKGTSSLSLFLADDDLFFLSLAENSLCQSVDK